MLFRSARRVVPRLAAAATVTAALVAGGTAATSSVQPSSPDDVVALVNAWPKKYTGVGLVVQTPTETVVEG